MSRTVAVMWHASFSIAAGAAYFFFVLPRWPELLGDTSHTVGTVLRVVTGALICLTALPVAFTLRRTRRPEFGTPALALRLHTSSIALHVVSGVLIIGTAISEIWLSLDNVGAWVFAIYGAAAANALLGIFAFYLAFVAELKPPPPKPLKRKMVAQGRRGRRKAEENVSIEGSSHEGETRLENAVMDSSKSDSDDESPADTAIGATDAEAEADELEASAQDDPAAEASPVVQKETPALEGRKDKAGEGTAGGEESGGKLLNRRRPSDKAAPTRRRKRSRGGTVLED
jgi:hypothetical protein